MNPDVIANVPPPAGELPPAMSEQPLEAVSVPEQAAMAEASGNRAAVSPPSTSAALDTVLQAVLPAASTTDNAMLPAATTPTAQSDNEAAFEKEMISKAKQIVNQTTDNPYEQNKQLAYVRTEFLQKRYGKAVKLAD